MIWASSPRRLLFLAAALCAVAGGHSQPATADSRKIVIDARYKPMSEIRQEYEDAVLGKSGSHVVNRQIVILIDSKRGFDAGFLQVPRNVKIMRTHVKIIPNGRTLTRPVSVNLLNLNRSRVYKINQTLSMRK